MRSRFERNDQRAVSGFRLFPKTPAGGGAPNSCADPPDSRERPATQQREGRQVSWYLLYAKAKHEFEAADAVREITGEAHCARKMVERFKGKSRTAVYDDAPMLPNFIFAKIPVERYLDVMAIRELASAAMPICETEMRLYVLPWLNRVSFEYACMERRRDSGRAAQAYTSGQLLSFSSTRFTERTATFRRMVMEAHDLYPMIEADMDMMGRIVRVKVDPLEVKAVAS